MFYCVDQSDFVINHLTQMPILLDELFVVDKYELLPSRLKLARILNRQLETIYYLILGNFWRCLYIFLGQANSV